MSSSTAGTESQNCFSFRHIFHDKGLSESFYAMLQEEKFTDTILSSDGVNIKAHRMVLSANSSYFKTLFDELSFNCHCPSVIVLKDIPVSDLRTIIEFMYRGEAVIEDSRIQSVLQSAQLLNVSGLTQCSLALKTRGNPDITSDKSPPNKRPRIEEEATSSTEATKSVANTFLGSQLNSKPLEIRYTNANRTDTRQTAVRGTVSQPVVTNLLPSQNSRPSIRMQSRPQLEKSTQRQILAVPSKQTNILQIHANPSIASSSIKVTPQKETTIRVETWTPSPASIIPEAAAKRNMFSSDSPVEIMIQDEPQSEIQVVNIDVKPRIFEIDKEKSPDNLPIKATNEPKQKNTPPNVQSKSAKSKIRSKSSKNQAEKSSAGPSKPRPSSESARTPPPPPQFRVMQRSSARPLRNIIKPPTSLSPTKTSEDKTKKKRRDSTGTKSKKGTTRESNIASSDDPVVECPSCGQVFHDEKNWKYHITNAHTLT